MPSGLLRLASFVRPYLSKMEIQGWIAQDIKILISSWMYVVVWYLLTKQDNVVRLVHYSFQQYLEDNWNIAYPNSQRKIAKICITYLMLEDFSPKAMEEAEEFRTEFQDGTSQPISQAQWQDSHRFFAYVAAYWSEHVRGRLEIELKPRILSLFSKNVHTLYSLQQYNKLIYRNQEYDTWPHEPSALHLSAYWGLRHITKRLLREGADVHLVDFQGRTPLFCAALNGHTDVADVLLEQGAVLNVHQASDATPLHYAVANDHIDFTKQILAGGAEPNTLNKDGMSPMSLAAYNGNLSMMDLLFRNGARVGKMSLHGAAPLEVASRGGHGAVVQWLIIKGLDVDAAGSFPLIEAVYANQPQIVRILLDAGTDIDAVNELGHTALCVAIKRKYTSLTERLVLKGADVNLHGHGFENESPLNLAIRAGQESSFYLLINNGAKTDTPFMEIGTLLQGAIFYQTWQIVEKLLRIPDATDITLDKGDFGASPLILAVQLQNNILLEELLHHRSSKDNTQKADINAANAFNITALHQAVYLGWEVGAETLIKNGADPRQLDLYGQSCLDWALSDKEMFRKLGGSRIYRGTGQITQSRSLKKSVRNLVSILIEKYPDRRGGRRIDYHYLGHCFLRLQEVEEATTSFEQQVKDISSRHEPKHNISCHICGNEEIQGARFVCYTCADIDLCATHMDTYDQRSPDPRCKRHKFLEIPGPDWHSLGRGQVNRKGETIDEWLRRLSRKYKQNEAFSIFHSSKHEARQSS